MGQVVALVVVQRQAKLTLVAAKVVAHEVGIFGEIDGLEGESPEALSAVDGFVLGGGGASAAGLRTPFSVHLLCSRPLTVPLGLDEFTIWKNLVICVLC